MNTLHNPQPPVSRAAPATSPRPRSMKTAAMRWLDHWLGMPLCFTFGVLIWFARRILPGRRRVITGTGTIAVFKFFGLGSIMQATPLLRAFRERYPQARLAFFTFEANRKLVEKLNLCDDVRIIRTRSLLLFAWDTFAQIVWLHRHGVEAVLDLEFFSKYSTLLGFLSGACIRVGFHLNDFWRYMLVTHPVYFNYYHHITDVYRQMAERLDVRIATTELSRIDPGPAARDSVTRWLNEQGWPPRTPLLGVNVNAGDLSLERRWAPECFAQLIKTLLERRPDLRILLTGAPDERDHVASVLALVPAGLQDRAVNVAGRWSLDEFIAALPLMSGFVTNDSGPMHLAASEGVPMVSLWGPGRPDFYAPPGQNHQALYSHYPCSPCLYMFTSFEGMWCEHQGWCMQALEPETVISTVERMLAKGDLLRADPPLHQ